MVRKGLVTKRGDNQHSRASDKLSKATSYAKQAATSLGVDERTVRRDLARGKKIAPAVLAEVSGTDLDKGRGAAVGARAWSPRRRPLQTATY